MTAVGGESGTVGAGLKAVVLLAVAVTQHAQQGNGKHYKHCTDDEVAIVVGAASTLIVVIVIIVVIALGLLPGVHRLAGCLLLGGAALLVVGLALLGRSLNYTGG